MTPECSPVDNLRYMPEAVGSSQGAVGNTTDFEAEIATMPAKLCSLPPLSSIATRVLSLSDDPDSDIKRLASVVEGDPAFAAEVLFLANSPLFGFPSKLQVLQHAMAILGVERIKSLAMTVAMRAFVGNDDPMIPQCWRHSVACAVIAEMLSRAFGAESDQAYSAALMHDVGRLGLLKSYPEQMHPVLGSEYGGPCEVLAAERAAAQADHQAAGAWLIKNWALPHSFFEICGHHHDPIEERDAPLLKLVKASCLLADAIGYSAVTCRSSLSYEDLLPAIAHSVRTAGIPDEETIRRQVETRLSSLGG